MSRESLEQFTQDCLRYPTLQQRLRATADKESFLRLTVQLGEESGYSFTAKEVEELMREESQGRDIDRPKVEAVLKTSRRIILPAW